MRQKKQHEMYPKDILFYLNKIEKGESIVNSNVWTEKFLFEEDMYLSRYERDKKYEQLKDVDKIKDKILSFHFDNNFKTKASKLIKEDKQKIFLLNFIGSITAGKKELFTEEKFKCYKGFVYSLFVAKLSNIEGKLRINFGIFFEKTPRVKPFSTYIEKIIFFDLSEDLHSKDPKEYDKIIYNFEQKYAESNNDLEYDKMIFLGDKTERLFYNYENNYNYYSPFPFELPTKNEIYKKINVFGKEYNEGFNMEIWDLKYPIDTVLNNLNQIKKFNYNRFFEKDILNFHPSKIETKLINMNDNFILSGRPGTGKTVIILIKVIIYYLRCLFEHSKIIHDEIDYDYINNKLITNSYNLYSNDEDINIEEENITNKIELTKEKNNIRYNIKNKESNINNNETENNKNTINNIEDEKLGSEGSTYKIIFTSLSQSLCAYVEDYFIQGINNSNIPLNIIPTNQKTYEKMSSFVSQKKYPLFLNFRKLLFMIDGSLNYQFFDRPNNNQLKKRQEDCDIRYYPDCEYDVMVNLSFLINRPGNIYFYRRKYLFDPLVMTEINEDNFYNNFNSEIKSNKILNNDKNSISSYEVYSNIISIIKGSVKSYICGYLSREEYYSLGKKICPFTQEQRKEIYDLFEKYEYWKANNKYFDMQDVVNYLIREVNIELVPNDRKLLDLVFIDEVQDFSINQLYLLFLISRDIKVLAGDTCQTISKINTFRFADLNNVLYTIGKLENIDIKEPRHIEINLNFRCQATILKFAHLIYEMIHFFFINTLDKVRMDFSTQVGSGEKPFLIPYKIKIEGGEKNKNFKNFEDYENKTGFDYFLKGLTDNNLFLEDEKSIINISFSVNHCVICRNNDIVKQLNKKYNNKIFCSTVNESKGLEYEIVIIYNFFKDSLPLVQEIWKFILKNIRFNKVPNDYLSLIKQNLDYEEVSQSIKDQIYTIFNKKYKVDFPQNISEQFPIFNFCSELKEFYVAITRARSRLFIYEENMDLLKLFIERINDLDILVQEIFIKKDKEKNNNEKNNKYSFNLVENFGDNFNLLSKRILGLLKFINKNKTTKEQLSKSAYAEYNQDNEFNYKKAFYLFQVLNEDIMKKKCLIKLKYIEMQRTKGSKIKNIKDQCFQLNKEIFDLINEIDYDDSRQIKGEVLINLSKYDEALEYFKSKLNYKKCGIVLIKKKEYENALDYFIKAKEYSFAVYCLRELEEYEKLYLFLLKNKEQFDLEHIQYFYKITCNNFFKRYVIPIKNIEELFKDNNNNIIKSCNNKKNKIIFNKKEEEEEEEDANTKKIEINNIISYDTKQNKNIEYIEKNNMLLSYIKEDKIKIKNSFINYSKSNNSIFDINNANKNNIYSLDKTKEQIIHLIKCFKDLLNFMCVYLQIIISKMEKTKARVSFIKECNNLILYIEKNKETEVDKLLEIMEKLIIKEHDYKVIIIGILKNIDAKEYVYNLYDIFIFKSNILEHILKDLPILYQYKKKNNKIDENILYNESIKQIVEYSKFLPLNEDAIINNIKSAFIISFNFEGLLGIIPNNDIKSLLDLSIIMKKQKLFELIIKKLELDFKIGKINNSVYKNITLTKNDISYYMCYYICMLIYKFFKYFLSSPKNDNKINSILEKTKIFPKIYNILVQLVKSNTNNLNDYITLIEDIEEYDNSFYKDVNNYEKNIKLIIIGTEISLIQYLYSHKKMYIDLCLTNGDTINIDLLEKYITIILKIRQIIENIRNTLTYNYKNNIPVFSLFNAFGIYSINKYLPILQKNYDLIKNSKIIKDLSFINYRLINIKECYFKMKNDIKENISKEDLTNFHSLELGNIFIFEEKILNILETFNRKNDIVRIYKYVFNLYYNDDEIIKNGGSNINTYILENDFELNIIIKYLNEIPYDGEYLLNNYEKIYYLELSKFLLKKNKNIYLDLIPMIIKKKDNKDFTIMANFILYSNLIGGMIKSVYIMENDKDILYNLIKEKYFDKNFSYIHAFNLISDYYSQNLNQLLIIIWLRKIYNCVYSYFYNMNIDKDNKYKLYINKKNKDIKLNIYEIKKILSDNDSNNDSFIEKYFNILSLYIIKNNTKIFDIKYYISEIYYSLITLYQNENLINSNNIKRKIKNLLDEIKSTYFLENKDSLKEVVIINDKELKNTTVHEEIKVFHMLGEEDDINEEYNENCFEDYDEIEQSLLKNPSKFDKNY